ncbi:MSMEG_0570 family nitrogen starvation response protein [Pseudomonas typographi]|uniref:MSMEG_0570 family nitrogen starvation response protein n=1 Tax=Pseudomonas typographi TaxID=2715964 RepID=A0ABR7Z446_9PSED|nr:MSMEG_0570 family nitrogen starvation response protein [Pseudomonas typographi]MBD1552705.1 MSMEG_0570 family nitrogen starvation response protein [Pseudomonas typographi]MBD1588186.1 MSMEG_0570 family nitrogen starvation response protein [Pseudomonas typographi]MBD1600157.1 MSMEG_0570 family nitrogen starvation response protein [Pseudomonas typographi]
MPAVNIRLRWPDGHESTSYSPSTSIFDYLEAGRSYPLPEFLQRATQGLNAAAERVKQVRGFYCSSAMDSLDGLRLLAQRFDQAQACVQVVHMQQQGAGQVHNRSFGEI